MVVLYTCPNLIDSTSILLHIVIGNQTSTSQQKSEGLRIKVKGIPVFHSSEQQLIEATQNSRGDPQSEYSSCVHCVAIVSCACKLALDYKHIPS